MALKRGQRNSLAPNLGLRGATLREENVGRKCVNPHSLLKLQHLQRLAMWAGGEASIPPLAAHFGRMLAANAEHVGIPLDRSNISCQRCETILQPGYNCTIRIKKNANGARRHRKTGILQNNVVYRCHFCSHVNLGKGTRRGHLKDLLASRSRVISESNFADSVAITVGKSNKDVKVASNLNVDNEYVGAQPPISVRSSPQKVVIDIPLKDSPKTPSAEMKENKVNVTQSGSRKAANIGSIYATTGSRKDSSLSSKRRRKSWSGLREITLSNEREKEQRMNNFAIPFCM